MLFCPNCGKQISDEAIFCPACGHKVELSYDDGLGAKDDNGFTYVDDKEVEIVEEENDIKARREVNYGVKNSSSTKDYQASSSSSDASILGTLSIIFGILIPILGIILGAVGLSCCRNDIERKRCKTGVTIGAIFAAIEFIVVAILIALVIFGVFGIFFFM